MLPPQALTGKLGFCYGDVPTGECKGAAGAVHARPPTTTFSAGLPARDFGAVST
jgi:hypothetical protein